MTLLQEKNTSKAKSTGRRILEGLFGNRNVQQQENEAEELRQQLNHYVRLANERGDRLDYIDGIRRQVDDAVSRLINYLQATDKLNQQADTQDHFEAIINELEELKNLIQQLHIDDSENDNRAISHTATQHLQATNRPVVLLATDHEATGQRMKAILETDHEVHNCRNGWQALAEVYRSGADIIIAEAYMEVIDGLTMCRRLRSNPQTSLITDNDSQHLQALQQGADACLSSSSSADIINCSVNNLLRERRQMQLNYEQYRRTSQQEKPVQKKKTANEKLIERVMNAIRTNIKDSSLSVDMIAEEVGMSRGHLNRKLKEIVGLSPHDFIRQMRLEQAACLLATSEMNISEVVYACGFSNSASFSTIFKKSYGLTPSEYMAEKRK